MRNITRVKVFVFCLVSFLGVVRAVVAQDFEPIETQCQEDCWKDTFHNDRTCSDNHGAAWEECGAVAEECRSSCLIVGLRCRYQCSETLRDCRATVRQVLEICYSGVNAARKQCLAACQDEDEVEGSDRVQAED